MLSTSLDRLALWRDLLAEQRLSSLSIKDWCAKEGISTFTYYYWRKRVSSPPSVAAPVGACSSADALPSSPEWLPVVSRTNIERLPPVTAGRPTFAQSAQKASIPPPASSTPPIMLRVGLVHVEVGDGFDRRLLSDVLAVL
jgi:hypothetical protein